MCKGPNEHGGPYRCSADMAQEHAAAVRAFDTALHATSIPSGNRNLAERALMHAEQQVEHARQDPAIGDATVSALEAAAEQRQVEFTQAQQAYQASQETLRGARRRLGVARANYQATPRGLAQLQGEIDASQPDDAQEHQAALDTALSTMNQESQTRTARWGGPQAEHVPISRRGTNPEESWKNPYAELAATDRLTASSVDQGYHLNPDTGAEGNLYRVTFYRPAPDRAQASTPRSMRVTVHTPTGAPAPSQADVLERMSRRGAAFEGSKNVSHYYRATEAEADERPAAKGEYEEGRRYARQLRQFLGDRAGAYLGQALRDRVRV